jgi:hypothetical protein
VFHCRFHPQISLSHFLFRWIFAVVVAPIEYCYCTAKESVPTENLVSVVVVKLVVVVYGVGR